MRNSLSRMEGYAALTGGGERALFFLVAVEKYVPGRLKVRGELAVV